MALRKDGEWRMRIETQAACYIDYVAVYYNQPFGSPFDKLRASFAQDKAQDIA